MGGRGIFLADDLPQSGFETVAGGHDGFHISPEPQSETPYSQPQQTAQGKEQTGKRRSPTPLKRRGVGIDLDDGEMVEQGYHSVVATVGQLFDDGFEGCIDLGHLVVGAWTEEDAQITRRHIELVAVSIVATG